MLNKLVSLDTRRPWVFPLGRSLQACNPRWWRRRRIVEISIALLSLMQDLQSHRGLNCAVLVGQSTFDEELAAVGNKLQRSLQAFGEQYSERQTVFRGAAWDHLLAHWESLRRNWPSLDFHTNLTVHSELILAVVGILRHIGQDNVRPLPPACVRVLGEWPTMAEHLGPLGAFQRREPDQQDRSNRHEQAEQHGAPHQQAQLAVVSRHADRIVGAVLDLAGNRKHLVQILGSKLAGR